MGEEIRCRDSAPTPINRPAFMGLFNRYNSFLLHANAIALFAENWYNRIRTCC